MSMLNRPAVCAAVSALALLGLAACSGREDPKSDAAPAGAPAAANKTLSAAVGDTGDLSSLERLIEVSGLQTVFEGVGPYTLLAPTDAALRTTAPDLSQAANRAAAAALLRAHILPGAVTRADIGKAIDQKGGPVSMRTMAGGEVTFARDGQAIIVTGPGDTRARLTGDEQAVSNGVIQPIDGLAAPAS